MDHLDLAARLEVVKWRDSQFEAINDQLEAALPQLLGEVTITLESASWTNALRASAILRRAIDVSLRTWATEQARIAFDRSEIALDAALDSLGGELHIDNNARDAMLAGLGASSGISAIAGSLLAIPTLTTVATVKSGGILFGLFATTTLSMPVLVAGGVGIGLAALTGVGIVGKTMSTAKKRLWGRTLKAVEQQVMGYGLTIGERSVLTDIQATILRYAESRIGNTK